MWQERIDDATKWSVFWDVGLGDIDLVIPKAYRLDNAVPIAGDQYDERRQLCVVGVAYAITTGSGPLGVRLTESVPGGLTRTIWEISSATAAVVAGGFQCHWPLTPASTGTPAANAARLSVARVGSLASGQLTVTVAYMDALGKSALWATPPLQLD